MLLKISVAKICVGKNNYYQFYSYNLIDVIEEHQKAQRNMNMIPIAKVIIKEMLRR